MGDTLDLRPQTATVVPSTPSHLRVSRLLRRLGGAVTP